MFYTLFGGNSTASVLTDEQKLNLIIHNPALAKVVYLNCDVFSLGKIQRKDGKEDEFIKRLKDPNYFQTLRQFLWTYRFWTMFGTAHLKSNSNRVDNHDGQMYWLVSSRIVWDRKVLKKLDKLVFSKQSLNDILKSTVKYRFTDGSTMNFQLKELLTFHDLKNSNENWFKGQSRVDSLIKILANVDEGLDAKNINLEFSRKYLVSGNFDPKKNLTDFSTMQDIEKESIDKELRKNKPVFPVKSTIEIKRFIENLAKLKLDESYEADLQKIGSVYNVPSELLDALKTGSTYENQEKALARHIEYSEMPKGTDLIEGLCKHFNLNPDEYEISWKDCSFMQVFEESKANVKKTNAETFEIYVRNGAEPNKAAEFLGIELEFKKKKNEQE